MKWLWCWTKYHGHDKSPSTWAKINDGPMWIGMLGLCKRCGCITI